VFATERGEIVVFKQTHSNQDKAKEKKKKEKDYETSTELYRFEHRLLSITSL